MIVSKRSFYLLNFLKPDLIWLRLKGISGHISEFQYLGVVTCLKLTMNTLSQPFLMKAKAKLIIDGVVDYRFSNKQD